MFLDPKYEKGREKIAQDLEEALSKAVEKDNLKRKLVSTENECTSSKSSELTTLQEITAKAVVQSRVDKKEEAAKKSSSLEDSKKTKDVVSTKFKDWMGVGDLDVSDDSESEEEEKPAKKVKKFV